MGGSRDSVAAQRKTDIELIQELREESSPFSPGVQGGDSLKISERNILKALMSNPKNSDRNIAKVAGVSQPTVTRRRRMLLTRGIIESYEIIPNLQKLGFEILVFSTIVTNEQVKEDNEVIYAVEVDVQKMFVISVHRKYADYAKFYRRYCPKEGPAPTSLIVPTAVKPMVPLSFKNIPF